MARICKLCSCTGLAVALATTHAVVSLAFVVSLRSSNILQSLAAILAAWFCFGVVRRTTDQHLRPMWLLLGMAFALWSAAQVYFTAELLLYHQVLQYPSAADALWLAFALPLLLIVIRQRDRVTDWVSWLDAGQAGVFFSLLGILVFNRHAGLAITQAYDVQGAALVLLCGLQYSRSEGKDRLFFRDLGLYLLTYCLLSSSAYRLQAHGFPPGSMVDLCWTLPACLFVVLAERTQRRSSALQHKGPLVGELLASHNLYGTSAFGLFALSLVIGIFLHQRRPTLGYVYIGVATAFFAIRTIYRDTQIVRANRDLRDACIRDTLTRLPNRTCLMDMAFSGVLHQSHLLLCNIDRTKLLNESLGREFVDAVLQTIADRMSRSRNVKQAFRTGGDEFVMLLHDDAAADKQEAALSLLQMIREPVSIRGRTVLVTATLGAADSTAQSVEEVLVQADAAVAHGKVRGRDQFVTYTPSMQRDAKTRLDFEARLKLAIESGHIRNHYQAIWRSADDQIVGFEALARWIENGAVIASPAQFIPVAEDTWMILDLGRKLLSEACEDLRRFSEHAKRPIWVSVNLSGKQLYDPTLIHHLRSELQRTGVSPALLKIEVTESFLLDDIGGAVKRLHDLRDLGVRIAIDDFGTGYSSLSYLATLPFDVLKVDRSFITGLEPLTARSKVTRAIVQLAAALDKEIVAEGVETRSEEQQLAAMGCDLLQGYLISKPLPPGEAQALVRHVPKVSVPSNHLRTDLTHALQSHIAAVDPIRL